MGGTFVFRTIQGPLGVESGKKVVTEGCNFTFPVVDLGITSGLFLKTILVLTSQLICDFLTDYCILGI